MSLVDLIKKDGPYQPPLFVDTPRSGFTARPIPFAKYKKVLSKGYGLLTYRLASWVSTKSDETL